MFLSPLTNLVGVFEGLWLPVPDLMLHAGIVKITNRLLENLNADTF